MADGNVEACLARLRVAREDLRGWEWHYLHRLCHGELLVLKHAANVRVAAFSADGTRIVTGSGDGTARVWDAMKGVEIRVLNGHTSFVSSAAFARGRFVHPHGERGMERPRCGMRGQATSCSLLGDTRRRFRPRTAPMERESLRSATTTRKCGMPRQEMNSLTLSRRLEHYTIPLIGGKEHRIPYSPKVSFSPDGSQIISTDDKTAKIWDAKTVAEIRTLAGHAGKVTSAAFSPDGSRIVTCSAEDKTTKVWDSRNGAELFTINNTPDPGRFSPDGSRIATFSNNEWTMRDTKSGAELFTRKAHTAATLTFSPDGFHLFAHSTMPSDMTNNSVITSRSSLVEVWDARTGYERRSLLGHTGLIREISFSSDRLRVLTVSGDQTVKVWDRHTGNELFTLKGFSAQLPLSASFSPDGFANSDHHRRQNCEGVGWAKRCGSVHATRVPRPWDRTCRSVQIGRAWPGN